MIPLQNLLNSLQAWAQEELAGQRRMHVLIERQESRLCANDPDGLLLATQALEPELEAQAERVVKRQRLFAAAARHWKVDPGALSLTSIVERCAPQPGLAKLRDELRVSTTELLRRNRRFSALASSHRRFIEELVNALIESGDPKSTRRGGTLVDAEA
ncbi:MAG: flagellar export chaperone FlgN [Planctomycetes bacterium]|nr:flagellar export chaperone FlgN [Planctomycetota bacterium]